VSDSYGFWVPGERHVVVLPAPSVGMLGAPDG
jgi:hypothetical protein